MPENERVIFPEPLYEGQSFQKLSLPAGADLRRKEFSACVFKQCDFDACDLSHSAFIDCQFTGCSFASTKLDSCRFQNAQFDECKLVGLALARVHPQFLGWSFRQCKLQFCNFGGLKMARSHFTASAVLDCDFVNTDLKEASFAGSDLRASKFHHSCLEKADFTGALNYDLDPLSNRLKGAQFSFPEVLSLLAGFDIKVHM